MFKVDKFHDKPTLSSGFNILPLVSPLVKPGAVFKFKVELLANAVYCRCSDTFIIRHQFGNQDVLFAKACVKGL